MIGDRPLFGWGAGSATLTVETVEGDDIFLEGTQAETVRGKRLVYLDNAATTQKPRQVIDAISRFPNEVQRAAAEHKTLHVTNLAFDLARTFNDFYKQCPVLKAEPGVRAYRLRLVAAARQTIANALNLLSIQAPEVM